MLLDKRELLAALLSGKDDWGWRGCEPEKSLLSCPEESLPSPQRKLLRGLHKKFKSLYKRYRFLSQALLSACMLVPLHSVRSSFERERGPQL